MDEEKELPSFEDEEMDDTPSQDSLLASPQDKPKLEAPHDMLLEADPHQPKRKNILLLLFAFFGVSLLCITGYIYLQSVQIDDRKVPPLEPATTATPSPSVDFNSWEIYQNDQQGFTFKYPREKNALVHSNTDVNTTYVCGNKTVNGKTVTKIYLAASNKILQEVSESTESEFKGDMILSVHVSPNPQNLSIQDWFKINCSYNPSQLAEYSQSPTTFAGNPAIKVSMVEENKGSSAVMFAKDNVIYHISGVLPAYTLENNMLFDQILSTFTFTGQAAIPPESRELPPVSTPSAPIDEPDMVVCTMEALQCPDGSWVGRQGPKCEFAKCPGQ